MITVHAVSDQSDLQSFSELRILFVYETTIPRSRVPAFPSSRVPEFLSASSHFPLVKIHSLVSSSYGFSVSLLMQHPFNLQAVFLALVSIHSDDALCALR